MARGKRPPDKPAPVSGPGALSQRTDGGAGQPIRSVPAEFQGQRQALTEQQEGAPLAAGGGPSLPGGPPTGEGLVPGLPAGGILGPTEFPDEPLNAGLGKPQVIPRNIDDALHAMYGRYPHPDILRLLPPGD